MNIVLVLPEPISLPVSYHWFLSILFLIIAICAIAYVFYMRNRMDGTVVDLDRSTETAGAITHRHPD